VVSVRTHLANPLRAPPSAFAHPNPQLTTEPAMKSGANQPNIPFPRKLYELIETESDLLVEWSSRGDSFFIRDQDEFCEHVLPKYFRHTKLTSFQRQLNLYGFRRITKGTDTGAYFHQNFHRDSPHLVESIKRMVRKNSGDQTATAAAARGGGSAGSGSTSSRRRGSGRSRSGSGSGEAPSWSQQQRRPHKEQEELERQLSRQHQQRQPSKARGKSRSQLSRQIDLQKQLHANSPSSPHSFPDSASQSYQDPVELMDEETLPASAPAAGHHHLHMRYQQPHHSHHNHQHQMATPHWPIPPSAAPASPHMPPPAHHSVGAQPVGLVGPGYVMPSGSAPAVVAGGGSGAHPPFSQSAPAEYLVGNWGFLGGSGAEGGVAGAAAGGPGLTRQVSASFTAHPAFGSIASSAGFDPGYGLSKSQPQPNSFFQGPSPSTDMWAVSDDLLPSPSAKLGRATSGNSDAMALEEWAMSEEALGSMDALDDFDFEQTFYSDMCPN